jgi:hypothetical protein
MPISLIASQRSADDLVTSFEHFCYPKGTQRQSRLAKPRKSDWIYREKQEATT